MQPCGLRDLARPRRRQSFGLKAGRVAGYARSSWAQRALKNIRAALRTAGFGTPLGATFVWPQDQASCGMCPQNLTRKGSKKHSCNLAAARFGAPLGATVVWPQGRASCGMYPQNLSRKGAKKNDHADLRTAKMGTSSGATVVWPQNQVICGLRPRHLGPKGAKKHSCNLAGCGIWRALRSDFRLASKPGGLRIESAAP